MLKVALFVLVVALAMACTEAKGGKRGKDKPEGGKKEPKDCSPWTHEECVIEGGAACGKGTKRGTRTGDNCPVREKTFPCRVPCAKNKCKYQKGDWSECDVVTNTITRTNTLKKGDATVCEATKVITKKCKNKNAESRKNKNSNRRRKGGSSE